MGWYQLIDIAREAAEERRAREAQPPEACPHDGEPLRDHDGIWFCLFCDYEYPRDGRLI